MGRGVMASRTLVSCVKKLSPFYSLTQQRLCSSGAGVSSDENFEEMLRKCKFVRLGRPLGKRVSGQVIHVVPANKNRDDLYVDIGWKFHAVVNQKKRSDCGMGSSVNLQIENLEETGHFLGQSRRITLCEASCKVI